MSLSQRCASNGARQRHAPGNQSARRPFMRAQRTMTSCSVTNMACPMCSAPVTFGGGMLITNGSPSPWGEK
jgi:hypothetical protein